MPLIFLPRIVTDGLVLAIDAANTKSYPGSGTTWYDISRNNSNGSLVNGSTFSSENLGTVTFNGVDQYYNLEKNLNGIKKRGKKQFSYFVWHSNYFFIVLYVSSTIRLVNARKKTILSEFR